MDFDSVNKKIGFKGETISNPVKAIRAKCLDCSYDSVKEIALCPVTDCALYPFRFGKNPYRQKTELSAERKERMREALQNARDSKKS